MTRNAYLGLGLVNIAITLALVSEARWALTLINIGIAFYCAYGLSARGSATPNVQRMAEEIARLRQELEDADYGEVAVEYANQRDNFKKQIDTLTDHTQKLERVAEAARAFRTEAMNGEPRKVLWEARLNDLWAALDSEDA